MSPWRRWLARAGAVAGQAAAWPSALYCGLLGRWRRRRGRYDRLSLQLHWRAWRGMRTPRALLALAAFRRDMGRPVPQRWRAPLARLSESGASAALRRRAAELLAHDQGEAQQAMARLRLEFGVWLSAARASTPGVCVVGNAAGLSGQGLGPAIDAATAVVRFNRCFSTDAAASDLGAKTDVWVISPACQDPPPAGVCWAVVSGPDPVGTLARWPQVQRLRERGVPVLTVPLRVWRTQVALLGAPPSAGVLILAWLAEAGATWSGVSSVGIGWGRRVDGRHHLHAAQATVGSRHRWRAEQALHVQWRAQGLRDLGQR